MNKPPVITIDGPSGCGKGTLCYRLAQALGWSVLDSGALYRTLAWAVLHYHFDIKASEADFETFIRALKIEFKAVDASYQLYCNGVNIAETIRQEACGTMASKLAAIPVVRSSLLQLQRDFRQMPGLVTDGRDMGTVVFPDAQLKIFLTASVEKRAERRYLQLKGMGIDASLAQIQEELQARDERDQNRALAPLRPSEDMILLDSSNLSADEVFDKVMKLVS